MKKLRKLIKKARERFLDILLLFIFLICISKSFSPNLNTLLPLYEIVWVIVIYIFINVINKCLGTKVPSLLRVFLLSYISAFWLAWQIFERVTDDYTKIFLLSIASGVVGFIFFLILTMFFEDIKRKT